MPQRLQARDGAVFAADPRVRFEAGVSPVEQVGLSQAGGFAP